MNKSLLIHGTWAIAAIATFVLGSRLFPAGNQVSNADSPARHQLNPDSRTPAADSPRPGRSGGIDKTTTTRRTPPTLEQILAQPDPMDRIRALLGYVDGLATAEIPGAIEQLRQGAPEWDPEAKMLVHMLLTRWAREDPDAALASLANLDFKRNGGDASSILSSIAAMDPQRAATWLKNPANGLVHCPMMGHILAGTVAKAAFEFDPGGAIGWAADISDEELRGTAVEIGIREWLRRDPEAAQQWANQNGIEVPQDPEPKPQPSPEENKE